MNMFAINWSFFQCCFCINIDAPLNFSIDSNASPKVKTTKEKNIGARSLVHSTSGVEGCWSFGMGTRTNDKWINYSHGPA
jgi:hypothetical protein